jgi:hypothetical protein
VRYVLSPFMWCQTGKCLVWLWTERVLRHIRDCLRLNRVDDDECDVVLLGHRGQFASFSRKAYYSRGWAERWECCSLLAAPKRCLVLCPGTLPRAAGAAFYSGVVAAGRNCFWSCSRTEDFPRELAADAQGERPGRQRHSPPRTPVSGPRRAARVPQSLRVDICDCVRPCDVTFKHPYHGIAVGAEKAGSYPSRFT